MLNRLKLFLILPLMLLTSCSYHNEKGYVIDKNYKPAYNTTMISMIYTGKVMIPVTYIIHHAESWTLDLDEDKDGKRDYIVYLKDKDYWESIEIGDYFSWEGTTCYDCEQTTRERQ